MSATAFDSDLRGSRSHSRNRKAVLAGVVGHILEWYDFAVYGYVAIYIAPLFFPSDDPTVSLLASLGAFGVGFIARPLGGFVFGRIGDRMGRRAVLLVTLLMMAGATLVIGLMPTFATLGIMAPVLLVAARLVQGFSAGGESTTAAAFIVEWAPQGRRGLWGSFYQMASGVGLLLGSLIVAGIHSMLGAEAMADWAWRIPFLLGAVLAPIAFMIRRTAEETPMFQAASGGAVPSQPNPIGAAAPRILRAFLLTLFWSVGFYFFLSYMPTYGNRELKIDASIVFWVNSVASLVFILITPCTGALSDRIGRKVTLLISCVFFTVASVPMFVFLNQNPTTLNYTLIVVITGLFFSVYTGPAAATLSELFPTNTRSSGMAIGYNISSVIFGGFTPFIATWLIREFGTPLAPIYYVSLSALVGGVFIATLRESAHRPLD